MKFYKRNISEIFLCLFFLIFNSTVYADSQRFVDFEYDGAGNIISTKGLRNLGPPDVTSLSPEFIHRESFAFITARGINLAKAEVTLNAQGVTLIDVLNVSETEIKLTLSADTSAQIGTVPVTFTTRLGSDTENIFVADRTPIISTDPNPIILTPDNQAVMVGLTFDQPFATEQVYDIKITDETVASVSDQTITLLAGETEVVTTVTGLVTGTTTLEINQLSNFLALGIPVIVTDETLPAGAYASYSKPLGVSAYLEPSLNVSATTATQLPLGVAVYLEPSLNVSAITATQLPLGVAAYLEPSLNVSGTTATQLPLGVAVYLQPSLNVSGLTAIQTPVGTVLGTNINQVSPSAINRSSSITLIVDGFELDDVTTVNFSPGDGITQTAAFTVTPNGSQMMIPISVASNASLGARAVVLTTSNGDQYYSNGVIRIE